MPAHVKEAEEQEADLAVITGEAVGNNIACSHGFQGGLRAVSPALCSARVSGDAAE